MQNQAFNSYRKITYSQVVQRVGQLFKMKTEVTAAPMLQTFSQRGRSYWEWLVAEARLVGYTLYPEGVSVCAHPRSVVVAQRQSLARTLTNGENLRTFRAWVGVGSPQGGDLAERHLYGIDPRSQRQVFARNSGVSRPLLGSLLQTPYINRVSRGVVDSPAEAKARVDAEALSNQFFVQAEARALGDPFVRPGGVVYIAGTNADGYWYVQSVTHMRGLESYLMELKLGRDSLEGDTTNVRQLPHTLKPSREPRLVNNLWVAT